MKNVFLLIYLLFQFLAAFSQDQILNKNNEYFYCKIVSIDSLNVGFKYKNPISNNWDVKITPIRDIKYIKYLQTDFLIDSSNIKDFLKKIRSFPSSVLIDSILEKIKEDFLYTYSGEVIKGERISIENGNKGLAYFRIDSLSYPSTAVKFFKYKDQVWANTLYAHYEKQIDFARRLSKGNLNYYEREIINSTNTMEDINIRPHNIMLIYSKASNKEVLAYYNQGFGDLKQATYQNLKHDLADNMESLKYLQQYRSLQYKSSAYYAAGIVAFLGSCSYVIQHGFKYQNSSTSGKIIPFLAAGLGVTFIWLGSDISRKKPPLIRKAIEIY